MHFFKLIPLNTVAVNNRGYQKQKYCHLYRLDILEADGSFKTYYPNGTSTITDIIYKIVKNGKMNRLQMFCNTLLSL